MSEHELDARRILCPLPVIRTQDAVKHLQAGDVLRVTATDPGVVHDIPAWCKVNGHTVLDIDQGEDEIIVTVEVGADA